MASYSTPTDPVSGHVLLTDPLFALGSWTCTAGNKDKVERESIYVKPQKKKKFKKKDLDQNVESIVFWYRSFVYILFSSKQVLLF